MQTVIKADDGDTITVHGDDLSIEQLTIRIEIDNPAYGNIGEFDQLTMSTCRARELGKALIQTAELVEMSASRLCHSQYFDFISAQTPTDRPAA